MKRFDIFESTRNPNVLLLNVQSHFLSDLPTRLMIPLRPREKIIQHVGQLHPLIMMGTQELFAVTNLMAAVPMAHIGKRIGTAEAHSHEITAAIDFLLQGF